MNYLAGSVPISNTQPQQLKSVHLRIPALTGSIFDAYFTGARKFWHEELTRLKFKNPTLGVNVELVKKFAETEPFFLSLEFESSDRAALEGLKQVAFPKPLSRIHVHEKSNLLQRKRENELYQIDIDSVEWKSEELKMIATRCYQEMGGQLPLKINPFDYSKIAGVPRVRFSDASSPNLPSSEIITKAQPAADPSKTQSTSPPETIYAKNITSPIIGVRHNELWTWLRNQARLQDRITPPKEEIDAHLEWKAEHKKRGQDQLRTARQNAYLKRVARRMASAKAEAQRVASEA